MQTMERSGVQFDMCPKCRGVWLDRGELEKLMEAATNEGRASAPVAAPQPPPQHTYAPPPQPSPWQGHQRPRYEDDEYYRKRKKRDSIFDIFD
jgi:Zn-finger nucleic acid-binding protein